MATPGTVRAAVIRAVTYRRVSTFGQLGGTSPETQLERALAIINRESWQHVGDFFDGGVSGAKESRPDLDRLFEMCRAGLVDVVVVGDLSRLSRDLRNSLNFEHELHQLGVEVIDADNPNADELARMFSYLQNHWMRDQIRKNTHRGILAAAQQGYWGVCVPPFGWRTAEAPDNPKRKVVVLHEAEAATIRKAVELIVDKRLTCWEAAKELNALGLRPRKGTRWTNTSLRYVLKSGHLAGDWMLRKHDLDGTLRDFPIRGPQIITPDRMRELREALDTTARARPGNRVYPLTGRVTGPCGQPYTGTYRPDRHLRQYECRTNQSVFNDTGNRCWCPRIEAGWLETTVWTEVEKVLSDPERLLRMAREYLDQRGKEMRSEADQLRDLDRRITEAKRRRTNLALAAADIGPDAVADALAEITSQIDELERMREQARAWAKANAERAALLRNLWRLAEIAKRGFADPTPEYQRDVLAALDVKVRIVRAEVRVRRHVRPELCITGVLPLFGNPDDALR
jgi:DNA invertase Pin-like site-specific DNA recombinase